jgi:hypothetical protein
MALCEDFEAGAAGAAPDATRWTIAAPDCSKFDVSKAVIDTAQAHTGKGSLRIDAPGEYCGHIFIQNQAIATLGPVVYGRFWVRMSAALTDQHVTFVSMRDTNDSNSELRMGGQSQILMWNRKSDDATLPELSPTGISMSTAIPALKWTCIEFAIDSNQGTLKTWVDGNAPAGLEVDGTATPDVDRRWLQRANWRPALADFKLGWEQYSNVANTLWFDDIALNTSRIGCSTP